MTATVAAVQTYASFDGTDIAYDVRGEGLPVLLHHGFAADAVRTGSGSGSSTHWSLRAGG